MNFSTAIILLLSTQITTFSQAAHFRGTAIVTSDTDFDTQRQELLQYYPHATVSNIKLINKCTEDVTVDGWPSIGANGGTFSPSGPMVPTNPFSQAGTRLSYWYTSAEDSTYSVIELNLSKAERGSYFGPNTEIGHISFSDYDGFSIPSQLKAMNRDGSPACLDSGMKTTYLPPTKQVDGTFACPYSLKPIHNSLCASSDYKKTNQVIKDHSWAWNPDYSWTKDYFTSEQTRPNGGNTAAVNYWCEDRVCENLPTYPQPVGALIYCFSDIIDTVEITFCPSNEGSFFEN